VTRFQPTKDGKSDRKVVATCIDDMVILHKIVVCLFFLFLAGFEKAAMRNPICQEIVSSL
jgi:hypothetical protein